MLMFLHIADCLLKNHLHIVELDNIAVYLSGTQLHSVDYLFAFFRIFSRTNLCIAIFIRCSLVEEYYLLLTY